MFVPAEMKAGSGDCPPVSFFPNLYTYSYLSTSSLHPCHFNSPNHHTSHYYSSLLTHLCFSSCAPSFYPSQNLQSDLFIMYSRSFLSFSCLKPSKGLPLHLGWDPTFLPLPPRSHVVWCWLTSPTAPCSPEPHCFPFCCLNVLDSFLPEGLFWQSALPLHCLLGSSFLQVRSLLNVLSSERIQFSSISPSPEIHGCTLPPPHCLLLPSS